ncbi:hypothetical protein FB567DRAFT_554079 [Paraphoma chrysanthemicola]|uniref:Secreted protein n=1 Tax=Paraphoma chrysanthemicola TaxID=798071 RepID=A0A8K0QWU5_9PLEO|nr:hypothetical protein FB567DRAFT_554079 [Paraphoma chrysanthemicola]
MHIPRLTSQTSPLAILSLLLATTITLVNAASCNNSGQGNGLKNIRLDDCSAMRAGRGKDYMVEAQTYVCRGQSTDGSYRWCNAALENIREQCKTSNTKGWYDYSWDGVTEHYECTAYIDAGSGGGGKPKPCKKCTPIDL